MKLTYGIIAAATAFGITCVTAEEIHIADGLRSIMENRCIECHNPKKKKGKLDLEHLLANPGNPEKWLEVYDAIEAGDMPPEEEPPLEPVQILTILENVPSFEEERRSRLLTPAEIQNSLIDFFQAERTTFNAEGLLSPNYVDEKYFTQQHEVMSPYYVDDLYQTLNASIAALVYARSLPKPVTIKALGQSTGHVSKTVKIGKEKGLDLRWKWKGKAAPFSFQHPAQPESGVLPAGTYEVSFDALTPNFHADIKERMAAPYAAVKKDGGFHIAFYVKGSGSIGERHMLKFIKIPIERQRVTVQLDLKQPSSIAIALTKGPSGGKFKYLTDEVYGQKGIWKSEKYPLPCVRILDVQITGPNSLVKTDMNVFGDNLTATEAKKRLDRMQQISLTTPESDYYATFEALRAKGVPYEEAYRKSVLSFFMSSKFLKIDYAANALAKTRYASYALLKSLPSVTFQADYAAFLKSKDAKKLTRALLNGDQFERFIRPFTAQWIGMDKLNSNPPAQGQFPDYYKQGLGKTFPEETFAFINYLFTDNRPIHELVTADYSFLNPSLHAFYETGDASADAIGGKEVVETYGPYEKHVFSNPDRGGLLGQGTFHTVNSNGVEESPIRRAVWILENILHRGVPEPSSSVDVEAFEAAKSMPFSKRIDMHSSNPNCANCHKRIDPLAVVMNSYDTIGKFKIDPNTPKLDWMIKKLAKNSKGRITDIPTREFYEVSYEGNAMKSTKDLKTYLGTQEKRIARAFLNNLLKFTLGRELVVADHAKLDAVVEANAPNGLRTADLYAGYLQAYFLD